MAISQPATSMVFKTCLGGAGRRMRADARLARVRLPRAALARHDEAVVTLELPSPPQPPAGHDDPDFPVLAGATVVPQFMKPPWPSRPP